MPVSLIADSSPSSCPLLHGIQAVRGFAAVLVVCHHMGLHSSRYWHHNWLGGVFNQSTFRVDFFFALSGFALWTAHHADAGKPAAWRFFLGKRLLRLYPLLVVLTLLKVLVLLLVPGGSLDSYNLLPSFLALPQNSFPIIVAAWTLSFEVGFAVLLTLCLALPWRATLPVLAAWGLLVSCTGFLLGIRPGLNGLGFLTHPFVLEFVGGVLAAEWLRRHTGRDPGRNRRMGMVLCAVSAVGLLVGATQHSWITSHAVIWQKLFWAVVFALGLGVLALWERSIPAQRWRLQDVLGLGRASYSIFLSHGFVLMATFAFVRPGRLPSNGIWIDVWLMVLALLAVLFGQAVWHWLERPLARWCRLPGRPAPGVRDTATRQLS